MISDITIRYVLLGSKALEPRPIYLSNVRFGFRIRASHNTSKTNTNSHTKLH